MTKTTEIIELHVSTELNCRTHSHSPMENCEGSYKLWHSQIGANDLLHHVHVSIQWMNVNAHAYEISAMPTAQPPLLPYEAVPKFG